MGGRKKILQVVGGGEFGGAEEHLLTLAGQMDPQEFELHTVCLFAEPLASLMRDRGLPVHVFPMRHKADLSPVGKVAGLIRTGHFDLVHTHGVRANLIGRLAARRTGMVPVVTTVHSVLAFDYARRLDRLLNALTERLTRRYTGCFIAVSEPLRRQLIAGGIGPDRVVTVPNGLELDKYRPDETGGSLRQELGLQPGQFVIGTVARLHPVKGHTYLLQAFSRLARQRPEPVLLIVGAGSERPKLEKQAHDLGVAGRVIFTGFRRDIPEVMASLDLMILPSLSEGQGLVVMEAMAMKKPVVASQVGGVPDLIDHGVNGWLVPPADPEALAEAIRLLAGDRDMAARLAEAGRLKAEKQFSARVMAARTAAVYRSMTKNRKEDQTL